MQARRMEKEGSKDGVFFSLPCFIYECNQRDYSVTPALKPVELGRGWNWKRVMCCVILFGLGEGESFIIANQCTFGSSPLLQNTTYLAVAYLLLFSFFFWVFLV